MRLDPLSVQASLDPQPGWIRDLVGRHQPGAARTRIRKIFAGMHTVTQPGTHRPIIQHGVTGHVIQRLGLVDVATRLADYGSQLNFIIKALSGLTTRIFQQLAVTDQRAWQFTE